MSTYKGKNGASYSFPSGQIYRFDLIYVVVVWSLGDLFFQKLDSYLMNSEGGFGAPKLPEFWANGDSLSNVGNAIEMLPLSDLHATGIAARRSLR